MHVRLHPYSIHRDSGIEIPEVWMPMIRQHNSCWYQNRLLMSTGCKESQFYSLPFGQAEFWATFSYGLLLQRFFRNSSRIFIISMKADTRNFSKKYQQNFLLDAIFFESRVLLSANFSRNIYHQWNRNISFYCGMISVVFCKVSQPSR